MQQEALWFVFCDINSKRKYGTLVIDFLSFISDQLSYGKIDSKMSNTMPWLPATTYLLFKMV